MKKIILMGLIILLTFGFTGCIYGSEFSLASFESNTMTSMSMKYAKFSGNKNKELIIKKDEYAEIMVDITTESGKIDLYIKDGNGYVEYEGHDLQTGSFTVKVNNSSKYKIRVEAKNHKGSYSIKWNIKSNK